jgi:hypothetical protein
MLNSGNRENFVGNRGDTQVADAESLQFQLARRLIVKKHLLARIHFLLVAGLGPVHLRK